MAEGAQQRCFVWYDLLTSDPDAATGFYGELIGWGTQPWEGGSQPYLMWTNGENPMGGVMQLPEDAAKAGAPPHWLAYVATPDTKATVARATELGACVLVQPTDIPEAGQFAVLQDPQGATFAVYTSAQDSPGAEFTPAIGEFSWHELATTDYEAAFDFYHKLFDWDQTESMDMGEAGTYQMYGAQGSGKSSGGMFNKPAEMPGPPAWLFYVKVEDVNAAVEKVKELGGQVLNGPMEVPGGDMVAQCMDPQGAAFALHSSAASSG
jgi:predicted enzyme related to lactoylglutathione lyase